MTVFSLKIFSFILLALITIARRIPYVTGLEDDSSEEDDEEHNAWRGSRPVLPDLIETTSGYVRGKMLQSTNGRVYTGFLGIPFSDFNETKRFQTASPLDDYDDEDNESIHILEATEFGAKCLQYDESSDKTIGEENCLFLNIFTPMMVQTVTETEMQFNPRLYPHWNWNPKLNRTEANTYMYRHPTMMPVIVYLHGAMGSEFQSGSGEDFGLGENFMDEDVVVVVVNSRLGPLGYLSTGDDYAMGNTCLKDNVLALEWIHHNIMGFGGDKFCVTLLGEGAGGISAHFLMMSPIAQGLFHRVISLGGTSLDPVAFTPNALENSEELGQMLGCPSTMNTSNSQDFISCMRDKDPKEIVKKSSTAFKRWKKDYQTKFGPTFETRGAYNPEGVEGEPYPIMFLPQMSYRTVINSGGFNKVPWLVGTHRNAGFTYSSPLINDKKLLDELNSKWSQLAPTLFLYGDKVLNNVSEKISSDIRKFYFKNMPINTATKENLTNLFTDIFYLRGMSVSAQSQSSRGQSVYPFIIDSQGDTGFKSTPKPSAAKPENQKFSSMLVELWTTFAKYGVPIMEGNYEWEPLLHSPDPYRWPVLSTLGTTTTLNQSDPLFGRIKFWEEISKKYGF